MDVFGICALLLLKVSYTNKTKQKQPNKQEIKYGAPTLTLHSGSIVQEAAEKKDIISSGGTCSVSHPLLPEKMSLTHFDPIEAVSHDPCCCET